MLERFYRYRVTCRCSQDGQKEANCPGVVEYETTEKRSLPDGWVRDEYDNYGEQVVNHYSGPCWASHCDYMIAAGFTEYEYRKEARI